MATFEEGFLYPLILLLVGAGVTSVLIPWFTKRWEDRRRALEIEAENRKKALEIKVDIASKMSEATTFLIGEARDSVWRGKDILTAVDQDARYEKLKKALVDSHIIRSKLDSYFPETDIKERWDDYSVILKSLYDASIQYFLKDAKELAGTDLGFSLEKITYYFSPNKEVNWGSLKPDKPFDMGPVGSRNASSGEPRR